MANSSSGRFTPKAAAKAKDAASKGKGGPKDDADKTPPYQSSGRYTPPQPVKVNLQAGTKPWVPYVMFGLFAAGLLAIVLNYISLLPNSPTNWYLLVGLVSITGGFMAATQLK